MANRIKPGRPRATGRIPIVREIPATETLRFSFRHLDVHHPKFGLDRCQVGYFDRFLQRVKDLSSMTVLEFRTSRSPVLRSHRIDFSETTERGGFASLNEQLRQEEAWQFEITRNEHGRVHGILLDDTFYIVWIDADHKLYE